MSWKALLLLLCYTLWLTPQHSTDKQMITGFTHRHIWAHHAMQCWLTPQYSTAQHRQQMLTIFTHRHKWAQHAMQPGSHATTPKHWQDWPPNYLAYAGTGFHHYLFRFHCRCTAFTQLTIMSLLQSKDQICISCSSFKNRMQMQPNLLFISG